MVFNFQKINPKIILLFFLTILPLLFSNIYWNYAEAINNGFSDLSVYVQISKIGRTLSLDELSKLNIESHFAERWVPNFLIGSLSSKLNLDLLLTYRIIIIITLLLIFIIIINTDFPIQNKICYFLILVYNPYTIRSYLASGYNINDILFLFSTIILVLGIFKNIFLYLIFAITLGIISRQTSVIFIFIILLSKFYQKINLKVTSLSIFYFILLFLSHKYITNILFNNPNDTTTKHIYGLFIWLFSEPKYLDLYLFLSRILFFLTILSPILLLKYNYKSNLFFIFSTILLILQPLLAGPLITGTNVSRLFTFSLPFIAFPILFNKQNKYNLYIFCFLTFVNSFHHKYSIFNTKDSYFFFSIFILFFLTVYLKYFNKKVNYI
jgi:hypothetical protein